MPEEYHYYYRYFCSFSLFWLSRLPLNAVLIVHIHIRRIEFFFQSAGESVQFESNERQIPLASRREWKKNKRNQHFSVRNRSMSAFNVKEWYSLCWFVWACVYVHLCDGRYSFAVFLFILSGFFFFIVSHASFCSLVSISPFSSALVSSSHSFCVGIAWLPFRWYL